MRVSDKMTMLTRIGFAARGLLYLVIGLLVIGTGRTEDPAGALEYLAGRGGRVLLIVMAAGLLSYGIWRLCDAAFNIEQHGNDRRGLAERLGAGLSGAIHLLLTWQALSLIRGLPSDGKGSQQSAEQAMALPGGTFLLMLGGCLLIVLAAVQLIKAWKAGFLLHLAPDIARQSWVRWSGRAGYAARGIVFAITGYFLVGAGLHANADEAGGMDQALSWLNSPVDIVIAAGLFCFGLFSLVEARFRVLHDVPADGLARRMAGG